MYLYMALSVCICAYVFYTHRYIHRVVCNKCCGDHVCPARASHVTQLVKESVCQCGDLHSNSWSRKIWRGKWQPLMLLWRIL